MKVYRDWRISGNDEWMEAFLPKVKTSLDYCIRTWDPKQKGVLEEPHHNTYDIEFWGPDGMCSSFYLGALAAYIKMGEYHGEDVSSYTNLLDKGKKFFVDSLYNGEYFIQKVTWEGLEAPNPIEAAEGQWNVNYSEEALELLKTEGPKYQYGNGCISDGVLGLWLATVCGLHSDIIDANLVNNHLKAIYKYNLKHDLSAHVNPQRPSFAMGDDGGLLLCTWPANDAPSLPFVYSNEVWTGIEYQVAAHLMLSGFTTEGLDIVQVCRKRYDGQYRNPFDEYECGHWYARAMSSYGMIQGMSGLFYDGVEKTLYLNTKLGNDFKVFISTQHGWGLAGLKNGKPFVDVKSGTIKVDKFIVDNKII
ncbi:GH116 family glycosyl hydrolase [Bacteroidota bacterium]